MLKKVSGAKSVFVRINNIGRNYLPFVEDLKDRIVRYISMPTVSALPFPYNSESPVLLPSGLFVSIADRDGNNYPIHNLPLEKFNLALNNGRRLPIMRVTSLADSYIDCEDASQVGKVLCLTYFYDLPEYSKPDTTMNVAIDSVECEIMLSQANNVFPDNRSMAGKRFRAISFPRVNPTISGAVGPVSNATALFVTFAKGNYNVIDNVSVMEFFDIISVYETLNFANICFDFTNSFVTVGGNVNCDGEKVQFNLTFEDHD